MTHDDNEQARLNFILRIVNMHEDNFQDHFSLEEAELVCKMYCRAELRKMVQTAKRNLDNSQAIYDRTVQQALDTGVTL